MTVKKFNRALAVGAFVMATMNMAGMTQQMKSMGNMQISEPTQAMDAKMSMNPAMRMNKGGMGIQMMEMGGEM